MHRDESFIPQDNFIALQQFDLFKRKISQQIQHLRAVLTIQSKQIDLLTSHKHEQLKEINDCIKKNEEIQLENCVLKIKIVELENAVHVHHCEISMLKNHIQFSKNLEQVDHNNQRQHLNHNQEKNTSINTKEHLSQNQQQNSKSVNITSGKYLIDNRKTNDIEEALESDDEDLIECVWYTNEKVIQNIEDHRDNPHRKQFTTQRKDNFLNITKNSGSGFFTPSHSFIHKDFIPFSKISKFTVKKIKVRDIFLIGIGTMFIFGVENAFRHRQLTAYSSNGYIWLNGDSSKSGRELKANQTIDMIIDRIKGTVSWIINDIQISKVHIPHQMMDKELYLVIMMFNKDDNIHLYHSS